MSSRAETDAGSHEDVVVLRVILFAVPFFIFMASVPIWLPSLAAALSGR